MISSQVVQVIIVKTKIDSTGKSGLSLKSLKLIQNFNFDSAVVGEIIKDSEGEKAGIELGDKILQVNNNKVSNYKDFKKQLSLVRPNESLKLTIERENNVIELNIKLNKNGKIWL